MDAKEIKAALKEARENIKNKDFKSALKLCKNVLKADRNNYVGLVLFGVTLQETDQKDQAPNAFKKAIDVSPKQILAWQGLASFYEKEKNESNLKELLKVYIQLLSLETDLNKFSDICSKLVPVCADVKEYETCVNALEQQELSSSKEQKHVIWKTIVSLLDQNKNLSPEYTGSLESALEKITNDGSLEDTEEYFKKYLKLLYKQKKLLDLVEKSKDMHNLYPKSEYPLEWICRAYSEQLTMSKAANGLDVNIDEYYEKLSQLNPNSSMVILAKGAKLYVDGSYLEAIDLLKQVLSVMPTSYYIWALLCQCYSSIYCYVDSEHCASEALRLMDNQNISNSSLHSVVNIVLIRSLSYQSDPSKLLRAVDKAKEFLLVEHGNLEVVSYLARAYIASGDLDSAEKCILVLEEQESFEAMLLNALKLKKDGMIYRALDTLKNAVSIFPNASELWLEIGKIHWEEQKPDAALASFLKAARLDPNNYENFVYLGKCYSLGARDVDKARRCYQKAFQLNQRSEEAGAGLSDIYRSQKYVDLNIQLLTYVTQQAGPGGSKWAWLRLGLYHQDKGNHQEAVDSLRCAVRCDPSDSHCWESLADAYYARGSYTSALKSYQRVAELNPEALYPAYQVASIKQLIGMFEESVAEYKTVVSANPKYVPALKGLGETCLLVAKSHLRRQMRGLCRDMCQEAVDALTVAAEEYRNLSCLWKLLGDVCTLMAELPESEAFLYVKGWLTVSSPQGESNDQDVSMLLQKEQVLQLGARCYCRSLTISTNSSLLWQDLAVNYNCQANYASSPFTKKQLREWALMAAKQCVLYGSKSSQHWNMLGVVAASPEINNLKLAQHAFIKSIQIEKNHNAPAWTNLGTIYFKLKEIKMANDAFRAAQRTDPTYIQGWLGQAMLAESVNHEDTMDLFRHTTSLAVHSESCLGYAQWVCSTLLYTANKTDPQYIYSIEDMHAVPTAGDCMTWYTGSIPTNACAFNMMGLLMERQKLYNTAAQAFAKSLKALENEKGNKVSELEDKVRCNYARVLVLLQRYDEAIQQYLEIKEASLVSQCGLALAYFKVGEFKKTEKYEDSYTAYETILHWLAPDDGLKSHVVQLKPPSVQGLFASCSLGIIHGDLHLSEMVLKELIPYQNDSDYVTHIAVFKAYIHYLQNRSKEAVRCLSSPTHTYPGQASLWLALALLLLNMYPKCPNPSSAAVCAQVALYLGRSNMDVSKVMSLVSLGHLFSEKAIPSLRSSQKAVHMFPHIPENWVVVIASYLPWCIYYRSSSDALWLKQLIGHVRRKMDATRQMGKWLSRYEHKVTLLSEEFMNERTYMVFALNA
ncbi:Tetratricopeptide repeat protein 37 [Gryllus bimaculatus]|nr:Tetratricopeptide repeat protein 37 [Gryllus bimaculatus]